MRHLIGVESAMFGWAKGVKKLLLLLPLCMVPWYHGAATSPSKNDMFVIPTSPSLHEKQVLRLSGLQRRDAVFWKRLQLDKIDDWSYVFEPFLNFVVSFVCVCLICPSLNLYLEADFRINQWKISDVGTRLASRKNVMCLIVEGPHFSPFNPLNSMAGSMSGFCVDCSRSIAV